MGQAKRRGTLEERKAQAIARDQERAARAEEEALEAERSLTPEQRRKNARVGLMMASLLAHPF